MDAQQRAALKAELKNWEKTFQKERGRAPTPADIKADPAIAAKYKAYSNKQKPASKPVQEPSDPFAAPKAVSGDFKVPSKPASQKLRVQDARSPAKLHSLIASNSIVASPSKRAIFSPHKPRDTPRTKARKWLAGIEGPSASDWKQHMIPFKTVLADMDVDEEEEDQESPAKANGKAFKPLFDDLEPAPKLSFGKDAFKPTLPQLAPKPKASKSSIISDLMSARPGESYESERKRVIDQVEAAEKPKAKKTRKSTKGKAKPIEVDQEDDEDLLAVQGVRLPRRAYQPYANRRKRQESDENDFSASDLEDEPWPPAVPAADEPPDHTSPMQLPTHLTALLSLDASPIKKHRLLVQSRKEELVKRLLHEPSHIQQNRPKSGLEDLADDLHDASEGEEVDEEGDDDWDSEPEGWKTLGGVDLIGLEEDDQGFPQM